MKKERKQRNDPGSRYPEGDVPGGRLVNRFTEDLPGAVLVDGPGATRYDKRAGEARKLIGGCINAEVLADELNLPSEVAQKLRGKRLAIIEVKDGVLLKPVGDPIAGSENLSILWIR